MKIRHSALAAACFLASMLAPAQASLVFDQVFVGLYTGDINTPSTGQSLPLSTVTVFPGTSDEVDIHSYAHVNIDPTSIHVRFDPLSQQQWGDIGSFNGLKITDLDWTGAKQLLRFTIDTNMVEELCNVCQPYTDRLIVGDNFVAFDWRRYQFTADSYFDVSVRPVPEPSTYVLMLAGLGVVGLAVRRRKSGSH